MLGWPGGVGLAAEGEEEGLIEAAQVHDAKDGGVVDLAEDVDDGQGVVDHGCGEDAAMLRHAQARGGLAGAEEGPCQPEEAGDDRRVSEPGDARREANRQAGGIDAGQGAVPGVEDERVDVLGAVHPFSVPAEALQEAIERMAGRDAVAAPGTGHLVERDGWQGVEEGQRGCHGGAAFEVCEVMGGVVLNGGPPGARREDIAANACLVTGVKRPQVLPYEERRVGRYRPLSAELPLIGPMSLEAVLLAGDVAEADGVEAAERGEEGDLDDAGVTADLDRAVDGGAVADLGDGHAEQGSGAFQPVDDRFVHVRGGADDGDRGGFLQLADAPVLGEALCAGSDRKSTRLNSSHVKISYAVFCLSK